MKSKSRSRRHKHSHHSVMESLKDFVTSFWHKRKVHVIVLVVFGIYLLLLPHLTTYVVPCMSNLSPDSYSWNDCTVGLVLDRFLELALVGFALGVLAIFYNTKKKGTGLKPLIISAVLMSGITIASYYAYINTAEHGVRQAPIFLDTLRDPGKQIPR